eukprot:m.6512 g.6512  ORF g.6512 m.6512 type:complete len:1268 (+) comp5165_c0_seq1:279-4082(+)
MEVGSRVRVKEKKVDGVVQFIGVVKFASGKWIGLELDEPKGKNDGSVQGEQYFTCEPNYGMFVRQSQLVLLNGDEPAAKPVVSKPVKSPTKAPSKTPSAQASPAKSVKAAAARAASKLKAPTSKLAKPRSSATSSPSGSSSRLKSTRSSTGSSASLSATTKRPTSAQRKADEEAADNNYGDDDGDDDGDDTLSQASSTPTSTATPVQDSPAQDMSTSSASFPSDSGRFDVYKKQLEQMQQYKAEWAAKQTELQAKLQEAEQRAASDRQTLESELIILREKTELATLDKEVAEEQVRVLTDQVEDLQDNVEELTLTVEILEAEKGVISDAGDESLQVESAALKATKAKVVRLTHALYKLREQNEQLRSSNDELKQIAEDAMAENKALSSALQQKEAALAKSAKDFREQATRADAQFNTESMVEQLTEQNLILEEQCQQMREELYELRQASELSDAMLSVSEANNVDQEMDCDAFKTTINKLMAVVQHLVDRNHEQAMHLERFRDTVKEKEEHIEQTQARVEASLTDDIQKQEAQMALLSHQLAENRIKARVQEVEDALFKLTESQAEDHIGLLKTFLPSSFFDEDYNGIQLKMLLDRIARKGDLVADSAREEFHTDEDVREVVTDSTDLTLDQYAFGGSLVMLLTVLNVESTTAAQGIRRVPISKFKAIGDTFPELAGYEAELDALLDTLRGHGLDPSVKLDGLRKACQTLRRINTQHISEDVTSTSYDLAKQSATIASATASVVGAQMARFTAIFNKSSASGAMDPAFGVVLARMRDLTSQCRDTQSAARKILRSLPQNLSKGNISAPEETLKGLVEATYQLVDLAYSTHDAVAALNGHVHGALTLRSLDLDTALQLCSGARVDLSDDGSFASKALAEGAESSMVPLHLDTTIQRSATAFVQFADALASGEFDTDPISEQEAQPAPWEQRAEIVRTSVQSNLTLPAKVEELTEELTKAKAEAKRKDKSLREAKVLLDGTRRTNDSVKHDYEQQLAAKNAEMEELKEEHKASRLEVESTLDDLAIDIKKLEQEKADLLKRLDDMDGLSLGGKSLSSGGAQASAQLRAAEVKIFLLKQAVTQERRSAAQARSKLLRQQIAELPTLTTVKPLKERFGASASQITKGEELAKQVMLHTASMTVVDVTRKPKAASTAEGATPSPATAKDQASKLSPSAVLAEYVAKQEGFRQAGLRAKDAMLPILAGSTGQPAEHFGSFLHKDYVKMAQERKNPLVIGHITIPPPPSGSTLAKTTRLTLTTSDLSRLHSAFV